MTTDPLYFCFNIRRKIELMRYYDAVAKDLITSPYYNKVYK